MRSNPNLNALEMRRLSKSFRLEKTRSVGAILCQGFGVGETLNSVSQSDSIFALREVTLSIPQGQVLGIIGDNGAGKTTLLRLMAGLSQPTSGEIRSYGRVSAMLGLITALNPHLSGRKNIEVSGLYYGHPWNVVQNKIPEIVEFADIGDFIDRPVRTYSSGMQARLSFSIVTGFGFNDTLLIDEALGAGDGRFAPKAYARIQDIIRQGRTVLLVSHSMDTILSICQRAIWLERGAIRMDGTPDQVVEAYRRNTEKRTEEKQQTRYKTKRSSSGFGITGLELRGEKGETRREFETYGFLQVVIFYHANETILDPHIRLEMHRADGAFISVSRPPETQELKMLKGSGEILITFDHLLFAQGMYNLALVIESATCVPMAEIHISLTVTDPHFHRRVGIPVLFPDAIWQWRRNYAA